MRQNSTWASGLLLFNLAILSCHGAEELRRLGRANTRGGVTEESGNDSRIVGGHDAAKGRYPNMVVLYNAEGQFECGGTLILPDVVLSAAHCVSVVAQAEVGRYDISQPALLEGSMTYALVDKIAHPAYGLASTYSNDMDYALFKLSDGGLPADKFKPLTINGNPNRPHNGDVLTITGWGAVAEGGYASRILQEVQLNYLTNNQCKSFPGYEVAITEDMMCANVDGGGKDACQGDSGGPAYLENKTGDPAQDVLVGVVSWGVGCARASYPGVYARTAFPKALDWIQSTACSMSEHSPCQLKIKRASVPLEEQTTTDSSTSSNTTSKTTELITSILPNGACFIEGTGLSINPICALDFAGCLSCGGDWLRDFPNCYLPSYGYSSTVDLCRTSSIDCGKCGGKFYEKPPTINLTTGEKHGAVRS